MERARCLLPVCPVSPTVRSELRCVSGFAAWWRARRRATARSALAEETAGHAVEDECHALSEDTVGAGGEEGRTSGARRQVLIGRLTMPAPSRWRASGVLPMRPATKARFLALGLTGTFAAVGCGSHPGSPAPAAATNTVTPGAPATPAVSAAPITGRYVAMGSSFAAGTGLGADISTGLPALRQELPPPARQPASPRPRRRHLRWRDHPEPAQHSPGRPSHPDRRAHRGHPAGQTPPASPPPTPTSPSSTPTPPASDTMSVPLPPAA